MENVPTSVLLVACACGAVLILKPVLEFVRWIVTLVVDRKRPDGSSSRTAAVQTDDRLNTMQAQVNEMYQWHGQIDPVTSKPIRHLLLQQQSELIRLNETIASHLERQNQLIEELIRELRSAKGNPTPV